MIPQFEVSISVDVNLKRVGLPPRRVIHEKNGLVANHDYTYLGPISWERADEALQDETEAISLIDSKATTDEEFEEFAEEYMEQEGWNEFPEAFGLDLGIIGPVFALYAIECFPITSCRGHRGGSAEEHPLVVFYAPQRRVSKLMQAALKTGVGLANEDEGNGKELIVYARNILDMRRFSLELQRLSVSELRGK